MSNALQYNTGGSRGNDWAKLYPEHWHLERNGGGFDSGRDFFHVHWEIRKPRPGEIPVEGAQRIIRLHVESPRHDNDAVLNELKHDVIEALRAPAFRQAIINSGYRSEDGGAKVSVEHIQQNKCTEAFRVLLKAEQSLGDDRRSLESVNVALGSMVDGVLTKFKPRFDDQFRSS